MCIYIYIYEQLRNNYFHPYESLFFGPIRGDFFVKIFYGMIFIHSFLSPPQGQILLAGQVPHWAGTYEENKKNQKEIIILGHLAPRVAPKRANKEFPV